MVDLHKVAVGGLKRACAVFQQDLEALPESAFVQRFGEKARTVADIVYEVNLVNDHIGMVIRGEKPFEWPDGGWITAPEGFNTKAIVLDAFAAASTRIVATADALTADDLQSTVKTEHGESTIFERLTFMKLHLWYHSGQLNFIQSMLGDTDWHWN